MRGAAVVFALALVLAAVAGRAVNSDARTLCHPDGPGSPTQRSHYGNIDRDADLEHVVETFGGCPHQSVIAIGDRCRGEERFHQLPGEGFVARLDFVEANGRSDGRELLFGLRPGRSKGRYRGNVGLVRLARVAVGRCPRPVYLLSYFLRPAPRRAGRLAHLELLRSGRRELRIYELFARGRFRETSFRYQPGTGRYAAYRVTTSRT
jgi:hypothetical protein